MSPSYEAIPARGEIAPYTGWVGMMERLKFQNSGLLPLAGSFPIAKSYKDTPIEAMLPVNVRVLLVPVEYTSTFFNSNPNVEWSRVGLGGIVDVPYESHLCLKYSTAFKRASASDFVG